MSQKINPKTVILILVALATFGPSAASAQPPGPSPQEGRNGPPPGRGFRSPPGFLMMTALDANNDGKLSAKEISNATTALAALDKDGNGKLSGKEIGWPPDFAKMFAGQGGGQRGRPETDRNRQDRGGPERERERPARSDRPDRPEFESE